MLSLTACNSSKSGDKITKIYQNLTISPAGGTYELNDGITLVIPAGAITGEQEIQIRKIDPSELIPVFSNRSIDTENVLAGYEALPDGLTFTTPITVKFTDVPKMNGYVPLIHYVDFNTNSYSIANTQSNYDPNAGILEWKVSHFSGASAEALEALKQIGQQDCRDNPDNCRCGKINTEVVEGNNLCSEGGCVISESQVNVSFPDCGTPVEVSFIQEIGSGCEPKITLETGAATLEPDKTTTAKATVRLGCKPLKDQPIFFTSTGDVPVTFSSSSEMSSSEGISQTTVTAGKDEGTATVKASTTISYNTFCIYAAAGGVNELSQGPVVNKQVWDSKNVEVKKKESFHITFDGVFAPVTFDLPVLTVWYSLSSYSIHFEYLEQGYYWFDDYPGEQYLPVQGEAVTVSGTQTAGDFQVTVNPEAGINICSAEATSYSAPNNTTFRISLYVLYGESEPVPYFSFSIWELSNRGHALPLNANIHVVSGTECESTGDSQIGSFGLWPYLDGYIANIELIDGKTITSSEGSVQFSNMSGTGTFTITVKANK
jgi:hypothetical protein